METDPPGIERAGPGYAPPLIVNEKKKNQLLTNKCLRLRLGSSSIFPMGSLLFWYVPLSIGGEACKQKMFVWGFVFSLS